MPETELNNRSKQTVQHETDQLKNKVAVSSSSNMFQLGSSIALGIVFGYLMNKSNVCLGVIIRDQMLFKRLIMLKMFIAALGMSMLSVALLIGIRPAIYSKVFQNFVDKTNRINGIQLMVGGALIGVGMVLAGSCPGTVFVQMGSGLPSSYLTGLGAGAGVLFYYVFLQNYLSNQKLNTSSLVLQQLSRYFQSNQLFLNATVGTLFIMMAFLLDYFIPYEKELKDLPIQLSWSPVWCGMGIGFLQLFFMILFDKSLGISTGFSVLIAQLVRLEPLKIALSSLTSFANGFSNMLTLAFSIAAIGGSFLATLSRHEFPLNNRYGASAWGSFLGGFLLLIGARCAGGCTSGQGISGVTHLLIGSLIATASMFGGGIIFAFTYALITDDWHFQSI